MATLGFSAGFFVQRLNAMKQQRVALEGQYKTLSETYQALSATVTAVRGTGRPPPPLTPTYHALRRLFR